MTRTVFALCFATLATLPLPAPADAPAPADGFARMDHDADARIDAGEHAAGARAMFTGMDADADSIVTAQEMDAAQARIHGAAAAPGAPSAAEKIAVIDTDGDGRLSADEHARGSRRLFAAMDADHDGALSRTEYDAGHAALAPRR
jgi:hypothetical protein